MAELVRGLHTPGPSGELDLGGDSFALRPGTRLAVEVHPQRWCLGYRDTDGVPIPCRDHAPIDKGRMCEACSSRDPWKWMHIVHRSQFLDAHLKKKMLAPHWLYVATFAGGMQKVGTAADARKQARLDEQGPIFAHWVAWAPDGLEIRELEDLVSAELSRQIGLGQTVRSSAKAAGLSTEVGLASLRQRHQHAVELAREVLDSLPGEDSQASDGAIVDEGSPVVEGPEPGDAGQSEGHLPQADSFTSGGARGGRSFAEPWPNPREAEHLTELLLRPYPGALTAGRHGFVVQECWGPVALVRLDGDPISHYAVDLSPLVGREVTFGFFSTEAPEQQDSLF